MKFEMSIECHGKDVKYLLTLEGDETFPLNLDHFDRLLIKECDQSNSIADKLLALETITRRIEQSRA